MIRYNELKIEGDYLIIDVLVEKEPYFEHVYIDSLRIDIPLTYGHETAYHIEATGATKSVTLKIYLPAAKNNLLFITPDLVGNSSPDTPCGRDENKIGVVYNKKTLMLKGLCYLKELGSSCTIPRGFIDFILKVKALDMSIETCNYTEAIKYWEMLNKMTIKTTNNSCGCYGLN